VDDECITGAGEESMWQAGHTLGAKQAHLGIQDVARKVGEPSQTPRAWAGAVVHVVSKLGVCVLILEEKWIKLKMIIEKYIDLLLLGAVELDHKDLLSDRGFLVYVTRSYPGMIPYLKGFHLNIEMWRGNRDAEGWKLPSKVLAAQDKRDSLVVTVDDEEAELAYLMRKKTGIWIYSSCASFFGRPSRSYGSHCIPVRPTKVVQVLYGFADASGKGLGSTVQGYRSRSLSQNPSNPRFRVGVWGSDDESESSNFVNWLTLSSLLNMRRRQVIWILRNFSYSLTILRLRALFTKGHLRHPNCMNWFCT
jgi:hypothetical protein